MPGPGAALNWLPTTGAVGKPCSWILILPPSHFCFLLFLLLGHLCDGEGRDEHWVTHLTQQHPRWLPRFAYWTGHSWPSQLTPQDSQIQDLAVRIMSLVSLLRGPYLKTCLLPFPAAVLWTVGHHISHPGQPCVLADSRVIIWIPSADLSSSTVQSYLDDQVFVQLQVFPLIPAFQALKPLSWLFFSHSLHLL